MRKYYIFIAILSVLFVLMIVGGIQLVGSPMKNRAKEADKKIVEQMTKLTQEIEIFYQSNKQLPASLNDINTNSIDDPTAKDKYAYKVISANKYEMCATFSTDNSADTSRDYWGKNTGQYQLYTHKKGENCITFTAPDLMTNIENPAVVVPEVGKFSSMSATLNEKDSQFNFEYSGKSSVFTVEMSTFPDFSENIYLTFASGSQSPLYAKKDVRNYSDYYCGSKIYWRIKADLGVTSEANEDVVCGAKAIPTPTVTGI